jgi:hypothetical protein
MVFKEGSASEWSQMNGSDAKQDGIRKFKSYGVSCCPRGVVSLSGEEAPCCDSVHFPFKEILCTASGVPCMEQKTSREQEEAGGDRFTVLVRGKVTGLSWFFNF